jgi:hypothetical protein
MSRLPDFICTSSSLRTLAAADMCFVERLTMPGQGRSSAIQALAM